MPQPKEGEKQSDYISRCVKQVMAEGATQEQALGKCYGMFRQAKKSAMAGVIYKMMQARKIECGCGKKVEKAELIPIEAAEDKPSDNNFNTLKYPAFLMSFPFNVDNAVKNNVWMQKQENTAPFDMQKAYKQWMDLYRVVSASGLNYILPSQNGLQDEIYVANLGICLPQHISKNMFLLSNFRSNPRTGEEDVGREFFNMLEFNIVQTPTFWEGEADLKYVRDNLFFGGYGIRTDIASYEWMMSQYDMTIIPIKITDEYLYHFDCSFFPINKENAFVAVDVKIGRAHV